MDTITIIGLGIVLLLFLFLILKFRKEFFHIVRVIVSKIRGIKIQFFTIPVVIIVMFIFYLITPDKYYYFIFIFIFSFGLYRIISHLMDFVYLVSLDWDEGKIRIYELSVRALNNYKILDEDNKQSYIKNWIKCSSGRVALVDSIDSKQKIIIANPIVTNFDFVRNYKDVDMLLKKTINKLTNDLAKMEGEMEFKTVLKAKEILENSSLLSTIVGETHTESKKEKKEVKESTESTESKEGVTSGQ